MPQNEDTDKRLLDYVQGRLEPAEASALEQEAAENEMLAAELAMLSSVRTIIKDSVGVSEGVGQQSIGWARLSRAIKAEKAAKPCQTTPILRHLTESSRNAWRAAAAVMGVITLGQSAALLNIASNTEPARYQTVSEESACEHPAAIIFNGKATESDLRNLLIDVGGQIKDGPSAMGLYRLCFRSELEIERALKRFEEKPGLIDTAYAE